MAKQLTAGYEVNHKFQFDFEFHETHSNDDKTRYLFDKNSQRLVEFYIYSPTTVITLLEPPC